MFSHSLGVKLNFNKNSCLVLSNLVYVKITFYLTLVFLIEKWSNCVHKYVVKYINV